MAGSGVVGSVSGGDVSAKGGGGTSGEGGGGSSSTFTHEKQKLINKVQVVGARSHPSSLLPPYFLPTSFFPPSFPPFYLPPSPVALYFQVHLPLCLSLGGNRTPLVCTVSCVAGDCL